MDTPTTRPAYPRLLGRSVGRAREFHRLEVLASAALVATAIVLLVVLPAIDKVTAPPFRGIDWRFYELTANRFLAGQSLYVPRQLAGPFVASDLGINLYLYAPPTVLFLLPFLPIGWLSWTAINAIVFVTGIAAMARRDFGRHWVIAAAIALSIIAVGQPYIEAVVVGNVNLGLAGLFAWAWASRGRVGTSGVIAAAGALVKVHPISLVALNPRGSIPRALAAALAVLVGVALVTLPIVGIQSWFDYVTAFSNLRPECGVGSHAPACALAEVAGPARTVPGPWDRRRSGGGGDPRPERVGRVQPDHLRDFHATAGDLPAHVPLCGRAVVRDRLLRRAWVSSASGPSRRTRRSGPQPDQPPSPIRGTNATAPSFRSTQSLPFRVTTIRS